MYRFTTPKHTFIFPEDPSEYEVIRMTYSQDGKVILEKEITPDSPDVEFGEDNTLSFRLTQEETGRFRASTANEHKVQIQAHIKDADGLVWQSKRVTIVVKEALDNKEL